MKFYGQTYWYPTPNNGLQEIGVTNGLGGCWIVAWFRGSARKRVKTPHLPPAADPADLQTKLDSWAAKREIKQCAIASR